MTSSWAWAHRELRRRGRSAIALVLLIGLSGAVALTAAAGARRTGSAFERFIEDEGTADAQLQYTSTDPALDARVLDALRADPDIEDATPLFITLAFAAEEDVPYDLGVYAGAEPALFNTLDGTRILEGRAPNPAAPGEVTINRFTQDAFGAEVGDTITVGTFRPDQVGTGEPEGEPAGPVIPLTVVGIHVSPYDLADPEFTGAFGTPSFHDEYGATTAGYGPIFEVAVRDGADPTAAVERAVGDFDLDEASVTGVSQQTDRVADGTRVLAMGLAAFAAVAALAALVAISQAVHRRMGEGAPDLPALRAVGFTRAQCVSALALAVTPIIVSGILLGLVVSIAASPLMPIGLAGRAEPHPGVDVDVTVLLAGTALMAAVVGATALISGVRLVDHARRSTIPGVIPSSRSARGRRLRAPLSAPEQLGVAMALDPGRGPRSVPVRSAVVGATFGVAGIVAALTFGSGLDQLVEQPESSGWNWTFAPEVGDEDVVALVDAPDVESVGRLRFSQVDVEDSSMTAVSVQADKGAPGLTVVSGRMPVGPREVAVGPKTADQLDVGIGSALHLTGEDSVEAELVVVGTVLFPTFDENAFNEGVALSPDAHDALARSGGFDRAVVTFRDGVSGEDAVQRMDELAPGSMSIYAFPSPPPDVANLTGVRDLPRLLGVFLGCLAVAAVGHALATSTRRRRRDLGIVRSLGFIARDVRRAVTAQSTTLITIGLLLGVPAGIALGRLAWTLVADGIGVPADVPGAPAELALVAGGALLAGALLAIVPGHAASRRRAVEVLRVE